MNYYHLLSDCFAEAEEGSVPLVLCHMLEKDFNHPPFLALSPTFRSTFYDPSGLDPTKSISLTRKLITQLAFTVYTYVLRNHSHNFDFTHIYAIHSTHQHQLTFAHIFVSIRLVYN